MRLKDKVAIITGGGSGIGRATAELFASEGARVVVADFNSTAAKEVAQAIQNAGCQAVSVSVDVSEPAQAQRMVDVTLETYGGIDILFNGAGILARGTALDSDETTWNRVMAVNLNGTFWCCKAVLPHLIKRGGGSIINVSSSTGAHDAKGNTVAYVTSKGGVTLMTKAMAIDHAKAKVRVNAICPGPTDTINSHFGASAGRADARRRDEVDVGHRRGAATKQMPARRRAPSGCGPQARWLCCSLLTYGLGIARRSRLASGPGGLQQNVKLFLREPLRLQSPEVQT
ncbi:MAG: short-chain dehydrogenase [Acidobacteria bacterium]|nr:MAG: short-chain dehydrogenase [Acidobacteriota bacterium]